ncbi:hypothetical protein QBC37DRAFT_439718 [Rhypophila decipiens]|uniref:Methyltransferase domain-containing protein n=1 Tax=Rhypophila decipiens TaxID=261697 RepID=A0AAN6Y9B3_9PEZI|nr:hypothetical protein QBC37DRAFT_439718 [Rhypophila decipiens]
MPRQPLEFYEREGISAESSLNDSARRLLRDYSHIPDDLVNHHVEQIRREAFRVAPYPCIGMFQFLDLSLKSMTDIYPDILDRVKRGDKFLDLGCCLGQEIRQLVLDGAPSANTYGSDLYGGFFDVGYRLFNDSKDSLDTTFIAADIFDDKSRLEKVALQVVRLLTPKPGSLIVGRQSGGEEAGENARKGAPGSAGPFTHNVRSWTELWEHIGKATGTRWSVEADLSLPEYTLCGVAEGKSKEMQSKISGKGLRYVIHRL